MLPAEGPARLGERGIRHPGPWPLPEAPEEALNPEARPQLAHLSPATLDLPVLPLPSWALPESSCSQSFGTQ